MGEKYLGATWIGKWFFWHLFGECSKNPNTHANLFYEELFNIGEPSWFKDLLDLEKFLENGLNEGFYSGQIRSARIALDKLKEAMNVK